MAVEDISRDVDRKREIAKAEADQRGLADDLWRGLPPAHPNTPVDARLQVNDYPYPVVKATGTFPPENIDAFAVWARASYHRWHVVHMALWIYDDRTGVPVLARRFDIDVYEELKRALRPWVPAPASAQTKPADSLSVTTGLPKYNNLYVDTTGDFNAASGKAFIEQVRQFYDQLPEKPALRVRVYSDAKGSSFFQKELVDSYKASPPEARSPR